MAELTMSGTLIHIGQPEKKSDKFTLQEIVVEEQANGYKNVVVLQLAQKQLEHASKLKIGGNVEVKANVKGREYNGKYFNSIEAWFVKQENTASKPMQPNKDFSNEADESLPF